MVSGYSPARWWLRQRRGAFRAWKHDYARSLILKLADAFGADYPLTMEMIGINWQPPFPGRVPLRAVTGEGEGR